MIHDGEIDRLTIKPVESPSMGVVSRHFITALGMAIYPGSGGHCEAPRNEGVWAQHRMTGRGSPVCWVMIGRGSPVCWVMIGRGSPVRWVMTGHGSLVCWVMIGRGSPLHLSLRGAVGR
jgi:hypothetical protein